MFFLIEDGKRGARVIAPCRVDIDSDQEDASWALN
jgi:hypothetical protein